MTPERIAEILEYLDGISSVNPAYHDAAALIRELLAERDARAVECDKRND